MTQVINDDNIGYVYMLYADCSNNCYIGSTSSKVKRRFQIHKACYKRWKMGAEHKKFTCFDLFDEVGIENIKVKVLKTIETDCKCELRSHERQAIESCKLSPINKNIPGRTKKEYYLKNKEKWRQYYQNNKQRIKEKYENNKVELSKKALDRYYKKKEEKIKELNKKKNKMTL